jgi:hypothetical protein
MKNDMNPAKGQKELQMTNEKATIACQKEKRIRSKTIA